MQKQNVVRAHWAVSLSLKKEWCCPARTNLKTSMPQKTTYHLITSGEKPAEANPERQEVEKWLGWRGWGRLLQGPGVSVHSAGNSVDTECRLIKCFKTVRFVLMNFTSICFEMLDSLQDTLSPSMEPRVI